MAGKLCINLDAPTTAESLGSLSTLLGTADIGLVEAEAFYESLGTAIREFRERTAALSVFVKNNGTPDTEELECVEEAARNVFNFVDDPDGERGYAFWLIMESCRFLRGEEVAMTNGDMYRDGKLISTIDQRFAETKAARANQAMPNWSERYRTVAELQERTELLDAISAKAIEHWGFPGKIFEAFGIVSEDGDPLVHIDDADHLASDVGACWARVVNACETKRRQYDESRLQQARSVVLTSIGRC